MFRLAALSLLAATGVMAGNTTASTSAAAVATVTEGPPAQCSLPPVSMSASDTAYVIHAGTVGLSCCSAMTNRAIFGTVASNPAGSHASVPGCWANQGAGPCVNATSTVGNVTTSHPPANQVGSASLLTSNIHICTNPSCIKEYLEGLAYSGIGAMSTMFSGLGNYTDLCTSSDPLVGVLPYHALGYFSDAVRDSILANQAEVAAVESHTRCGLGQTAWCPPPAQCSLPPAPMATVDTLYVIHAGDVAGQCCSAMTNRAIFGTVASNPAGSHASVPACWANQGAGPCVNATSTVGNVTTIHHPANQVGSASLLTSNIHICLNPPCIKSYLEGLATSGIGAMSAMFSGLGNYTDLCTSSDPLVGVLPYHALGYFSTGVKDAIIAKQSEVASVESATRCGLGQCAWCAGGVCPVVTTTPAAEVIKVASSLTVGFTLPANTTASSLNTDTTFKTAMAASIKASLTLPTGATVTVTLISAARRALLGKRSLSTTTLNLKVDYEITGVTASEASAVYTEISTNGDTFAAAVKTNSVAQFTSAGLTGYTVDSVVAAAPQMSGATPPTTATTPAGTVLDDTASSGAFTVAASGVATMALIANIF